MISDFDKFSSDVLYGYYFSYKGGFRSRGDYVDYLKDTCNNLEIPVKIDVNILDNGSLKSIIFCFNRREDLSLLKLHAEISNNSTFTYKSLV